ncbi:MAG: IS66 family insertion sequence element accessory protein TnpB [Dehalococcoidia bacterium]
MPTSVRIYLARGETDMRKSIDGLAAITKSVLSHDPLSGYLFVFCNRRRDRIKILYRESFGRLLLCRLRFCLAWQKHPTPRIGT